MMIVGHNPGMPEAWPSEDWDHLKKMLSSYRFYVHTADPRLVSERFSLAAFKDAFTRSIETARTKHTRVVPVPITEIKPQGLSVAAPGPTIIDPAARSKTTRTRTRKAIPS
jgi:hypothetical protein